MNLPMQASALSTSQGPFTFLPAAPQIGRATQAFNLDPADCQSTAAAAPSLLAGQGSSPQGESAASPDRTTVRSALCKQAFHFVDALRTGHIDVSQNKTGLTMVFERLGDVPMPKDEWYARVFRNFGGNEQDLIDFKGFREIVRHWDEHHVEKRLSTQTTAQMQRKPGEIPPPPPTSEGYSSAQSSHSRSISSDQANVPSPDGRTPSSVVCTPHGAQAPLASSESPCFVASRSNERDPAKVLEAAEADTELVRQATGLRVSAANIASEVMFPTYVGRLAIFDDYEFFGIIGSGSFRKVVRHRNTKQLRARKVVAVETALQRELMDTEIRLLKSLNHPNIMKMHEVYFEQANEKGQITNGNIYLVTELCEGGDLFSRILHHYERLKQPMTESHVAYMMQHILSATKYCHDKGIIHRDIKPENILFVDRSSSSSLKIIDFGLANFTEKIREQAKEVKVARCGAMGRLARMLPSLNGKHLIPWHERKRVMQKAGTLHYMAPEMIEGSYDQKADLFSIGIILCQLFTGWHPFYMPGDDEASVRAKISNQEPVQFPSKIWAVVSEEACDLCRKLLEKSPKNRLGAAQALAHPWFQDPSKPSPFGNVEGLSVSIFDGLMQYQAYNKLKRAVLQLLTRELSEFQIQELRGKFMALDTQGDGLLSPEELIDGMRHVGYEMSASELSQIMAALDGSGNQRIGYKELISALIERRVKFDRQQLFQCFKKFDKQGLGRITYEDVKSVMCNAITESEWQEIAVAGTKSDPNQVPELTFDEFVALMEQTAPES
ncbi:unnamed protein product [Polarella glacialis]|uniref:Non-specific serine/threonine protein kinase n=1 Tax=Polarella glacialis TaxID=89957 RepID=A0A813FFR0_POLGL|nr:unnamed protein product [Polarella glacialis]